MSNITTMGNNLVEMTARIKEADEALIRAIEQINMERDGLIKQINLSLEKAVTHLERHRVSLGNMVGEDNTDQ